MRSTPNSEGLSTLPTKVSPEDWRPVDIHDLERNAWTALRRTDSTLVVAGPGSGKTEFLAQRAAYLLQTNLCPAPYRILAISFKVDAADNLARRVQSRCTESESRRFVSLTFDAFTKSLVDRFSVAIPEHWRPTKPYDIFFPDRRDVDSFLDAARRDAPSVWKGEVAGLRIAEFESRTIGCVRLSDQPATPKSGTEFAAQRWWAKLLNGPCSRPTFTCLNRVAELAIRTNPQLRRALLVTYPFIFVDEFQDTTYAQYDFLSSVFSNSSVRVTAVGDDKQRIMAWAGAHDAAFSQFMTDFTAHRIPLILNHRSSPGLVRVQQVVARAIDSTAADVESRAPGEIGDDVAQVWRFATREHEASTITSWLKNDMANRGKYPRDYALLVRQRADVFEEQLRPEFELHELHLRNEGRVLGKATLQNLLAEESTRIALAILRLGAHVRAPEAWTRAHEALVRLWAIDPRDSYMSRRVQDKVTAFIRSMRSEFQATPTASGAGLIVDRVFGFLDRHAMRRAYIEYASGDGLEIAIEAFGLHLQATAAVSRNWIDCVDLFEGHDSTPLMTVHKSKGLEYDTVVFMGLDDESWWSHRPGDLEGRSTFFVALSRAKQRVVFTYCQDRARVKVADLYQILTSAGVAEIVWPPEAPAAADHLRWKH